jgi:hypothetical protein
MTWTDKIPTKEGLYWLYGHPFNVTREDWTKGHPPIISYPEPFLFTVLVAKRHDDIQYMSFYKAGGNHIAAYEFDPGDRIGHPPANLWLPITPPELPRKENKS